MCVCVRERERGCVGVATVAPNLEMGVVFRRCGVNFEVGLKLEGDCL